MVDTIASLGAVTLAGLTYSVEYREDLWLGFSEDRQQFCKDTWLKKAESHKNVRRIVLRLIPDELFPVHGHDKPYVIWQQEIDAPPERGFTVDTTVTVTVLTDSKYVDPVMRADISRTLAGSMKGVKFQIVNRCGDVIEHGRI